MSALPTSARRGFTLLEMVLVAVVLSILTVVVAASYQSATQNVASDVNLAALANLSAAAQVDGLDSGLTVPSISDFATAISKASTSQPIPNKSVTVPTSVTVNASSQPGEVSVVAGSSTGAAGQTVPATGVAMLTPLGACLTELITPSHAVPRHLLPGAFTTCSGSLAFS